MYLPICSSSFIPYLDLCTYDHIACNINVYGQLHYKQQGNARQPTSHIANIKL